MSHQEQSYYLGNNYLLNVSDNNESDNVIRSPINIINVNIRNYEQPWEIKIRKN